MNLLSKSVGFGWQVSWILELFLPCELLSDWRLTKKTTVLTDSCDITGGNISHSSLRRHLMEPCHISHTHPIIWKQCSVLVPVSSLSFPYHHLLYNILPSQPVLMKSYPYWIHLQSTEVVLLLSKQSFYDLNMKGRQGWHMPLYMNSADFLRDVEARLEKLSFDQAQDWFSTLCGTCAVGLYLQAGLFCFLFSINTNNDTDLVAKQKHFRLC